MAEKKNKDAQKPRRPRLFDPGWRDRHYVRETITLNTPEAKALANAIPIVSNAACLLGFAMQRYAEDIRVLSLLEAVDEEIFKSLGKDLADECKKLELLATENGVKWKASLNPASADVDFTHRFGMEYAKMVENMDKLVLLLCGLDIAGIINNVELKKAREKWYQLIRDAGFRITKLARETLNQAREEHNGKEAATANEEEAAAQDSPETTELSVGETPEPESTVPGGNGRRSPRKTARSGTEEQHLEVPPGAAPVTGVEETVPVLEQAV